MKQILPVLLFFIAQSAVAAHVSGIVKDSKGNILSFASIIVKGTSKGVAANNLGRYSINLEPGTYTLLCQYVGYKSEEKLVTIAGEDLVADFILSVQELTMPEVTIRKGEDPAIEIIRQTIKKRNYYNSQVDSFTVDVYIKGLLRTKKVPERMMGQKTDRSEMEKQGFDSVGRGILFLSESQTKVSFTKPDKIKYEVISSRQSGGGYGIAFPFFINFYTNNVEVFKGFNPRGFVSPIADNAFHYYNFHYDGNFFENGKMIDRIRVTPKRKFEPLFNGYIQIVDDEWHLHSIDLTTTKDYQLEMLDTVRIRQIQSPVNSTVWRTQNQAVYLAANTFGIEWSGNFLNVYNNYDLTPGFEKKYFNRVIMSYDTAFDKKDSTYWSNTRPVPLEAEEKRDFIFRDSLYKKIRDSISKRSTGGAVNRPLKPGSFLFGGVRRTFQSSTGSTSYYLKGLISALEYNTVEGLAVNVDQSAGWRPKKGRYDYDWEVNARYGVSNHHFNPSASFTINTKPESFRAAYFMLSGGSRVSQFNHDEPITRLTNSIYTLFYKRNYIKLYENRFVSAEWSSRLDNGLRWKLDGVYEDRFPLENTEQYSLFKKERTILPNHPYELAAIPFERQQAFVASAVISFQPGQRYVQFPKGRMPLGSKYPTLELVYSKGIRNIFGSDVDFDKWKFSVYDDVNLKMGGLLRYRISAGGFLNSKKVALPDFQHFNGNQTIHSAEYLNSFQLAPYYRYSNTEKIYLEGHLEHHFNGLITNKIPVLRKLKWNLVVGTNMFYVNGNNYYGEAFAGLENILKIFRVDFVFAYQSGVGHSFGIRLGAGGILGGRIAAKKN